VNNNNELSTISRVIQKARTGEMRPRKSRGREGLRGVG
jgi:hypothetical protein